MTIDLKGPVAPNGAATMIDVRQIKKALNRLGYYTPFDTVGISGMPDQRLFSAIKNFQRDQGLPVSGQIKPGDATLRRLNEQTDHAPDGQYIWRTCEDDDVRPGHAQLNRTTRKWSDSPAPGEEVNCRCWAEPVQKIEGLSQEVTSEVNDAADKWADLDFQIHFMLGRGSPITLQEIGYLNDIIELAKQNLFKKVEDQVSNEMRKIKNGWLSYNTDRSYSWPAKAHRYFGSGTIRTSTTGYVSEEGGVLSFTGKVQYEYDDTFTDPWSKRQKELGISDPEASYWLYTKVTDGYGSYFKIQDEWETEITGSIPLKD